VPPPARALLLRPPALPAPPSAHTQYTLILTASKNLPGQCVDFMKAKTIHRKSVGVRLPDDRICQVRLYFHPISSIYK